MATRIGNQMNKMLFRILLPLMIASSIISGCTTAVVGSTAAGIAAVHDRRSTGAIVDDQQIELRAIEIMNDNPQIDVATKISVISHNRQVLIIGQAGDMEAAREYARLLADIPNVRAVYNEVIESAKADFGDDADDAFLTSKVKVNLVNLGIDGFDATRVNVSTSLGKVYLMGLVTREEAAAVIEKVRTVGGVKKVIDIFEYVG